MVTRILLPIIHAQSFWLWKRSKENERKEKGQHSLARGFNVLHFRPVFVLSLHTGLHKGLPTPLNTALNQGRGLAETLQAFEVHCRQKISVIVISHKKLRTSMKIHSTPPPPQKKKKPQKNNNNKIFGQWQIMKSRLQTWSKHCRLHVHQPFTQSWFGCR